ncbi:MAG: winged helix-turn-helix domain-containing protein [Conexivisphaera sp.]
MHRRKSGRSRLRIYLDVLEIVYREGGKVRFTKLLSESNIPYDRFIRYEDELERRGLISESRDGDARYVELTAEGAKFLEELRRMERFLRDLGLGL